MSSSTSFNPYSDNQDRLSSLASKFNHRSDLRLISLSEFNSREQTLSVLKWSRFAKEPAKLHLEINTEILHFFSQFKTPINKEYVHFVKDYSLYDTLFKKMTDWDNSDLFMPLWLNDEITFIAFLEIPGREKLSSNQIFSLSKLQKDIEFSINIAESIQKEKDLLTLMNAARDKKTNYDSLANKIRDINEALTELQKNQERIIQKERLVSLNQITVTLNHEINNPLTHVLGMAQLLSEKYKRNLNVSDEEFYEHLNSIYSQGQRIVNIIEAMRKISVPVIEKYLPHIDMIKLDLPGHDE